VALVDAPLLITGESGTGKELSALAIHERSRRNTGPFIAVNCAALPSTLIQSELFGYEKGAFTGAQHRKMGRIESAEGGTLFLDEIGDLPLDLQVNLLRFLQQNTIQRVGGKEEIPVNVRIIAATHVDLEQAVKEGRFREDLYYRLNVLQMKIPSLRDRDGDVEVLANYFFKRFSNEKHPRVKGFRKDTIRTMNSYNWPGNVRELINRVRRAMVMCDGSLITPRDFGLERRSSRRVLQTLAQARYNAERSAILAALRAEGHNISQAAKLLGTSRVTLHRLITKYELNN
ncbi:MAG: sigma-54-dependent Fis family transcriptional regulator, partial [Gammaproteobacteria bacterium]|nr:sigma-54-dependent Fis family transcriptional regulator [Gammaproteobacteria bacterium]NIQ74824.1 sigma-54-dependent Fis family transcriptional regulator [Gammaproteobacteria bacterium]NIR93991.1 sigma-54-dependent Fis family transcriptional regulator [Gammaproteobacteria bacterium]NIV26376.1 AAA domain-containing protein [Gammaproteobacteria bacterium]NIW10508.1 AAA domain-containing protein [Gammaproteobacteria bacterium]